jgi:surfeit locus 1 family protein
VTLAATLLAGFSVLAALGAWQLQRLSWKRELIERVEERVHADPVPPPGPALWRSVDAGHHEYRRVLIRGRYLHDRETLVQAVTELGAGFWVMTPFETVDGYTVLVNRGFVSPAHRRPATRSQGQIEGETTVIGLLRMSEPRGGFLRTNDSAADRWYSRDVAAISAARGLRHSAPYFVDAEVSLPVIASAPVGSLTVITFANNHLQYALTWFALASMLCGGAWLLFRGDSARPYLSSSVLGDRTATVP